MINVSEEIDAIKILSDFKSLKNENPDIRICNFEILKNTIIIDFIFRKKSQYRLDLNFLRDNCEISFFNITRRPSRLKLINGQEILSIVNYLNTDETLLERPIFKSALEKASEQERNFEGFLLIYVMLINNVVKNGVSILADEIHNFEHEIIFNYDNKIKVTLERDVFSLELNNVSGNADSGFSMYYETLLEKELDSNDKFSITKNIIKRIQKVEDEYFGK